MVTASQPQVNELAAPGFSDPPPPLTLVFGANFLVQARFQAVFRSSNRTPSTTDNVKDVGEKA